MSEPPDAPLRPTALYVGLGLTTCSMLLLQQFLTRVFSVLFNSGLAFLAISVTFLGLGSAGVCAAVLPRLFRRERLPRILPPLALGYALSLTGGVALLVRVNDVLAARAGEDAFALGAQVERVAIASAILLVPMFLVGLVISLVLKAHVERVNRLYGADLLGGGLGCLLVLPLMSWIGGDDGAFTIGAIAALGAAGLARAVGRAGWALASAAAVPALLAAQIANADRALIDVEAHPTTLRNAESWVRYDREVGYDWNELSRIGIYETEGDQFLYLQIDSSCQATIPTQDPSLEESMRTQATFENVPYVLGQRERYLEIGAGGGTGMLRARAHGVERITGVEINPTIVESSLAGFPGFGVAPLVEDPAHRLVLDEGRSFVRASREKYDTITITFIQTMAASGSAAFALSEANLFTVEAFVEFLEHLTDDGVFYVYRHGGHEMLRLISIAREALERLGATAPPEHLFIVRDATNHAMLLAKRSPLEDGELDALEAACAEAGLLVAYSPRDDGGAKPPNPLFDEVAALRAAGALTMGKGADLYARYRASEEHQSLERTYLRAADPDRLADEYLVDVRPTYDDRPYYFFYALNRLGDFPLYFSFDGLRILGGTVMMLFWMLALFTVLVSLLIALPLVAGRRRGGPAGVGAPVVLYFSALGLGYVAVQISFVQRFVLFLGHPVYAVSVVLLAFLAWTGLGAIASDRVFRMRGVTLGGALALLAATLLAANQLLPAVFASSLISAPVPAKIVLAFAAIAPIAFQMGLFFPRGMRWIERASPDLVPWAWGANSAASVLGAILALIVAIHRGFWFTTALGAAIYLAVAWPAGRALASRTARAVKPRG